ncbi:FAD-dependent oxidoreductase [Actinoplanes sp. KI2]|uniref:NAD(P)/FAD-dependent oxidoreductase n=1 Tax=Actinoplanes sp. KI2 TaxID=2983315 RepID=UPI0021D5D313|nr:FAD-dependent oxidoreductase [Actinoplanes sp. KI2]MCU7728103.1 FAD-dependent oxidoreductase [Actinoplanes sp. KI2]
MAVVVVGAGIAGLACARELVDAGVPARVVERDTRVGGRLASEWLGGRWVDTGAAYLTADDPAFQGRLQSWRIDGLVRPWTDTLRGQAGPPAMRWAAPGGLRSLAEDLARGLEVTLGVPVTEVPAAGAVVLAMPGPQALAIADLPAAREQTWSPVVTAIITYARRSWTDFAGAFVNDHPVLSTVCDDGDRRGDRAPVLVAHSTAAMAECADPGPRMAGAVGELLGIGDPVSVQTRHWPYASPSPGDGWYARHGHVYLCGDAFGRPRVQTAWLSGRAVARAIIQSTDR